MMLTRTVLSAAFVSFALAACGGGHAEKPPEPVPNPPAAAPVLPLHFAECSIGEEGSPAAALTLHADGKIEVGGKVVGSITAEGKLLAADGTEAAAIDNEGNVRAIGKDDVLAKIDADGTLHAGDKTVRIEADGKVSGTNPAAKPLMVSSTCTAEPHAATMFVLVLATMPAATPPPPGPTSAPAPTPPK